MNGSIRFNKELFLRTLFVIGGVVTGGSYSIYGANAGNAGQLIRSSGSCGPHRKAIQQPVRVFSDKRQIKAVSTYVQEKRLIKAIDKRINRICAEVQQDRYGILMCPMCPKELRKGYKKARNFKEHMRWIHARNMLLADKLYNPPAPAIVASVELEPAGLSGPFKQHAAKECFSPDEWLRRNRG